MKAMPSRKGKREAPKLGEQTTGNLYLYIAAKSFGMWVDGEKYVSY
jgi:hypothetical protein